LESVEKIKKPYKPIEKLENEIQIYNEKIKTLYDKYTKKKQELLNLKEKKNK